MRRVEIRASDILDLSLALELPEDERGVDGARNGIVPPVELHEVEAIHPQPLERAIDDAAHVGAVDAGQGVPVGHELRVHLEGVEGFRSALGEQALAELPDHFLDAGINVGAIEGRDARIDEGGHVGDGPLGLDSSMSSRKLPAAAQHA